MPGRLGNVPPALRDGAVALLVTATALGCGKNGARDAGAGGTAGSPGQGGAGGSSGTGGASASGGMSGLGRYQKAP